MKKVLIALLVVSLAAPFAGAQGVQDLGKIVVTPTRYNEDEQSTGSQVTVISAQKIADSNAKSLSELLSSEAGLNVYQLGTPNTAVVDLRGFGETAVTNTLILVDGIRMNPIDISGANLTQIPVGAIERIEILRGSGSVLYGDNATGGVVNIITKKGSAGHAVEFGGRLGSYQTKQKFFALSGEKNKFTYNSYSSYFESDGYRENSYLRNQDHHVRLGYDVNDQLGFELTSGWHQERSGFPGGLTYNNMQTLGRDGSSRPNDSGSSKDRYVQLKTNFAPWDKNEYGHFEVEGFLRDRDTYATFPAFNPPADIRNNIDTIGLLGKYVYQQLIADKQFNFVTGIDYYDNQNKIFRYRSSPVDVIISKKEIAGYANAELEVIDNLFINAGSRYQQADYNFDQRETGSETDKEVDRVVSGGGLRYEYAPGSNVHVSVDQNFRFPATDEFYSVFSQSLDTNLKPQKGIQYEVGVKHNFADISTVNVTPYWLDIDDEIFFDPNNTNINIGSTRRIGVEIGQETNLLKFFEVQPLTKLTWSANAIFQNPEARETIGGFSNINKGDRIPMVPQHTITTSLLAQLWEHYEGRIIFKYVGSKAPIGSSATFANYAKLKAYTTADLQVAYKQKNYEIFGAVNNIFDEQYSTYESYGEYFPAPEINYEMGVNIKF